MSVSLLLFYRGRSWVHASTGAIVRRVFHPARKLVRFSLLQWPYILNSEFIPCGSSDHLCLPPMGHPAMLKTMPILANYYSIIILLFFRISKAVLKDVSLSSQVLYDIIGFLGWLRVTNPMISVCPSVWSSVSNILVVWRIPLCEQHNYQNNCTDIPVNDVNELGWHCSCCMLFSNYTGLHFYLIFIISLIVKTVPKLLHRHSTVWCQWAWVTLIGYTC